MQTVPDYKFRAATWNIKSHVFGGANKPTSHGKFLRDTVDANIYFLTEVDEHCRTLIRKSHGQNLVVWPEGMVGLFFRRSNYKDSNDDVLSFNHNGIHGAVKATLTHVKYNLPFVACATHIRPSDAFKGKSDAQIIKEKLKDVDKVIQFLKHDKNVVVGGDWNTSHARARLEAAGYRLVTPWSNTLVGKEGKTDQIYIKGPQMAVRNLYGNKGPGLIIKKTNGSDHYPVRANLTRKA